MGNRAALLLHPRFAQREETSLLHGTGVHRRGRMRPCFARCGAKNRAKKTKWFLKEPKKAKTKTKTKTKAKTKTKVKTKTKTKTKTAIYGRRRRRRRRGRVCLSENP